MDPRQVERQRVSMWEEIACLRALAWHLRMCRRCGDGDVIEDCSWGRSLWAVAGMEQDEEVRNGR